MVVGDTLQVSLPRIVISNLRANSCFGRTLFIDPYRFIREQHVLIDPLRFALSFGLSLLIGGLGYWRRSLTAGGWLGANIIGTATAGLGGWYWGALIVVFFVTSSALSHWQRALKQQRVRATAAKGERRDLLQTLANGGIAAGCALIYAIEPQPILYAAALGAVATVTADTWATELGTLSRGAPRLVTTGRHVPVGTSGGVSTLGLAATTAGALLIGLVGWLGLRLADDAPASWVVPAALLGGVAGSLTDSLLGATRQRVNWCPQCSVETEQTIHRCGTPAAYHHGWRWLDNDWVNFVASGAGAMVSLVAWGVFGGA